MPRYRHALPQLNGELFLTDGGLETWLIFHYGLELRKFASFEALGSEAGQNALRSYYRPFLDLANTRRRGFVLESPTWRANQDWGQRLGYSKEQLAVINRQAIQFIKNLREEAGKQVDIVLSGNVGPRGDGYDPGQTMSYRSAQRYHEAQIATFSDTECDMVTALTLTTASEAVGLTHAANDHAMPVAIGFTVETDGRLPNGQKLSDAIEEVDFATDKTPAYYIVNCAHPDHFSHMLAIDSAATRRVRGIRANASRMSHAELDNAQELDEGNPREIGSLYGALAMMLPQLSVIGGCCGTDIRHVEQMCTHTLARLHQSDEKRKRSS